MTLENEAHFSGLSVTISIYKRHKLYNVTNKIINDQSHSSEVEVDI